MNKAIFFFCRLLRHLRLRRLAQKIEMWMFERLISASLLKAYGEFYDSIRKATDIMGLFIAALENRHPEWCEVTKKSERPPEMIVGEIVELKEWFTEKYGYVPDVLLMSREALLKIKTYMETVFDLKPLSIGDNKTRIFGMEVKHAREFRGEFSYISLDV